MATTTRGANWKKAKFYNADSGADVVECHFNPFEYTITKQNKWTAKESAGASLPDTTFGGVGARQLKMTLVFDSYETKGDVRDSTDKLLSLMQVPDESSSTGKDKRPPHVEFGWGKFRSFRAVLTQATQKFTLFAADGTPLRASVDVTLQEVAKEAAKDKTKGQNPTSQAFGARRMRMVQPGDTIDWIAAETLGDPKAWRRIAETNRLDDPRRLRLGQTLLIPEDV